MFQNKFQSLSTSGMGVTEGEKQMKKPGKQVPATPLSKALNQAATTTKMFKEGKLYTTIIDPNNFVQIEATGVFTKGFRSTQGKAHGRPQYDKFLHELRKLADPDARFHCTPPECAKALWQLGEAVFPDLINNANQIAELCAGTGMLAAMGIQALSEDLDHVTLYDNNPEVLKHAYENFSRHCEKHLTITTVIADHNKNHGFDLTADIVMANPDFETEHLLKVISNMETFSRQDSLKLAIVPSHLYEDVRNLIFSTNRIAKDIFPELKIQDRAVVGLEVPIDTGRSWSTYPNAIPVHLVAWGRLQDQRPTYGTLPFGFQWPEQERRYDKDVWVARDSEHLGRFPSEVEEEQKNPFLLDDQLDLLIQQEQSEMVEPRPMARKKGKRKKRAKNVDRPEQPKTKTDLDPLDDQTEDLIKFYYEQNLIKQKQNVNPVQFPPIQNPPVFNQPPRLPFQQMNNLDEEVDQHAFVQDPLDPEQWEDPDFIQAWLSCRTLDAINNHRVFQTFLVERRQRLSQQNQLHHSNPDISDHQPVWQTGLFDENQLADVTMTVEQNQISQSHDSSQNDINEQIEFGDSSQSDDPDGQALRLDHDTYSDTNNDSSNSYDPPYIRRITRRVTQKLKAQNDLIPVTENLSEQNTSPQKYPVPFKLDPQQTREVLVKIGANDILDLYDRDLIEPQDLIIQIGNFLDDQVSSLRDDLSKNQQLIIKKQESFDFNLKDRDLQIKHLNTKLSEFFSKNDSQKTQIQTLGEKLTATTGHLQKTNTRLNQSLATIKQLESKVYDLELSDKFRSRNLQELNEENFHLRQMGDTYRMQYEVMVENQSKWLDQSNKKKDNNDDDDRDRDGEINFLTQQVDESKAQVQTLEQTIESLREQAISQSAKQKSLMDVLEEKTKLSSQLQHTLDREKLLWQNSQQTSNHKIEQLLKEVEQTNAILINQSNQVNHLQQQLGKQSEDYKKLQQQNLYLSQHLNLPQLQLLQPLSRIGITPPQISIEENSKPGFILSLPLDQQQAIQSGVLITQTVQQIETTIERMLSQQTYEVQELTFAEQAPLLNLNESVLQFTRRTYQLSPTNELVTWNHPNRFRISQNAVDFIHNKNITNARKGLNLIFEIINEGPPFSYYEWLMFLLISLLLPNIQYAMELSLTLNGEPLQQALELVTRIEPNQRILFQKYFAISISKLLKTQALESDISQAQSTISKWLFDLILKENLSQNQQNQQGQLLSRQLMRAFSNTFELSLGIIGHSTQIYPREISIAIAAVLAKNSFMQDAEKIDNVSEKWLIKYKRPEQKKRIAKQLTTIILCSVLGLEMNRENISKLIASSKIKRQTMDLILNNLNDQLIIALHQGLSTLYFSIQEQVPIPDKLKAFILQEEFQQEKLILMTQKRQNETKKRASSQHQRQQLLPHYENERFDTARTKRKGPMYQITLDGQTPKLDPYPQLSKVSPDEAPNLKVIQLIPSHQSFNDQEEEKFASQGRN